MATGPSLYRTYRFIDKDPVIDKIRTVLNDEGLSRKGGREIVHQLSGVSTTTLANWFDGETKRPQNPTIEAVLSSLGYTREIVKVKDIDVDTELKKAADWLLKQNDKKPKKKRVNATNGPATKTSSRRST